MTMGMRQGSHTEREGWLWGCRRRNVHVHCVYIYVCVGGGMFVGGDGDWGMYKDTKMQI